MFIILRLVYYFHVLYISKLFVKGESSTPAEYMAQGSGYISCFKAKKNLTKLLELKGLELTIKNTLQVLISKSYFLFLKIGISA